MYNVLLIANNIINFCNKYDMIVSNLKLQKLLYFIQGNFLAKMGEPCFPDEIEAWDFGPVVPKVYYRFRIYGSSYIPTVRNDIPGRIAQKDYILIEEVIDKYAPYAASKLVEITHAQDPWKDSYKADHRVVIPRKKILQYFKYNG